MLGSIFIILCILKYFNNQSQAKLTIHAEKSWISYW